MCGIAGVLNLHNPKPIPDQTLKAMILAMRHRGPDEFGIYRDSWVGLANARLSIVDLAGGQQPIGNEDGSLWIVFNGEIFNYVELRPDLEARGHRFETNCDTEVVLHMYEEYGPDCLKHLNGQFAIAIWDTRDRSLFLARDRVGIRPLYYTTVAGRLLFGSEVKSLLAYPGVMAEIDREVLRQVFTYWSPLSPRSIFRNINELPSGHYLLARDGRIDIQPYWALDFTIEAPRRKDGDYLEELESLLVDATTIRLRADVPVGAYLSGGLDSSVTAALIRKHTPRHLDTFSISFSDADYDESGPQRVMAAFLGTHHQELVCTHEDIARVFPDVIWHTEVPLLRTAPAPMFLLSELVHRHSYKVVLTGEGADELLAGYDIFKEMQIRRFWARQPESKLRPALFRKIYPEIPRLAQSDAFLQSFFKRGLELTSSPFYSHEIRWANTARTGRFLAEQDPRATPSIKGQDWPVPRPAQFNQWSPLAQAQYLEITTFLSSYLLSAQGDRMSMAHSVEGRYPFLDYRVIEFCNRLPDDLKLRGLSEKWLLRQLGRTLLPDEIWQRRKRPYRAPIQRSFFTGSRDVEYVEALLAPEAIRRGGYFNPGAVEKLAGKARGAAPLSEVEEMALVGILSTQLVDQLFVHSRWQPVAPYGSLNFKIVDLSPAWA
jgi:asparagine synthase (glutamine-hydrolysing)